jgi:hypothetical protein
MRALNDLTGKRFGRLTAQWPVGRAKRIYWLFLCDCGTLKIASTSDVVTGHISSCGCFRREVTSQLDHGDMSGENNPFFRHGLSHTPEHDTYCDAKKRCVNPRSKSYPNYGGRGIKFLFTSFEQFLKEVGSKPTPVHSIDRINNDGHYEPGNVKWSTRLEQARNKRAMKRRVR